MAVSYMTKEGYDKILSEINYLETVKRPEISAQIAEARDKGDLSENAEYDAAKEAQGIMEAKLAQLKGLIANARLIDESRVQTDEVQILNKVKIKNTKNNAVMTYTLVSDSEANLKEGKIAVSTPIAQGLMGKKVGDVVEIKVPSGLMSFEIMASIFSKIVAGEIPSYKVAENEEFYAFLDINPVAVGHTLVIPKVEIDYLFDIDDAMLGRMMAFAKRVARAQEAVIPCKRVGLAVMGLEVPHAHIHLIPMQKESDMHFGGEKKNLTSSEMADLALQISEAFK